MERIEKLRSFIAADSNDLFSRHALAMELAKLGKLEMAVIELEAILILDENYIGSYYHLGKLFEKLSSFDKALHIYEKGISVAKHLHKQHELRELQGALNQLKDELA